MFNKTRKRIVFTVVISLLVLMTVTLSTIYLSNRLALQRQNTEMLEIYAERFEMENRYDPGMHGFRPIDGPVPFGNEMGRNEPAFRLSTFYSVAFSLDGRVIAVNNGNNGIQSEEDLLETATSILESGREKGISGNLSYLVDRKENYTLVAMIDNTISNREQLTLIRQMLIYGSIAMGILFAASIYLAKGIVRPLEESDERQKRFVSDAGHELKTPIAVISANSELLKKQVGENEWLANIDYENERMSDLVRQLLELSHAENDRLPKEKVDFSTTVSGEVLPFESVAYEKGCTIRSDIEEGITVEGNQNQLRQLVSILLDNALSHGTGKEIELTLKKEKRKAVLTVANEAPVISKQQLSQLFDRFYRQDDARNGEGSHYGLGLSIAKAICEAHDGKITADYSDGKAVFTVELSEI